MENMVPNFLKDILEKEYSSEEINEILSGYKQKRNTTLRVNTLKTNICEIKEKLQKVNIKYIDVEWYKDALILDESQEKNIQSLDMFKNGEIYLQSLSSMIPPIVLNPKPKENILDMCAAPRRKNYTDFCNIWKPIINNSL